MDRREVLTSGVVFVSTLLAGCTRGQGNSSTPGESPPTPNEYVSEKPNPDIPITVENNRQSKESGTLRVIDVNEQEEVTSLEFEIQPNSEKQIYNLKQANPDGVQPFRIVVEHGEKIEEATIKTSECYGEVLIVFSTDSEFYLTHSIC